MLYFIIVLNVLLGIIITSTLYPVIGIAVLGFSALMIAFGCNNPFGEFFINTQIKHWGNNVNEVVFSEKRLLMSVACLTLSLKISAAIAILVEAGAIIMLTFCILLACGYLIEGRASGITIGQSYSIAQLIIKIFSFVSIGFDKIAEWVAKAELYILNIKT